MVLFLPDENMPYLLKLLQHVVISESNVNIKRVFILRDKCNWLTLVKAESEQTILFKLPYTCAWLKIAVPTNKRLIRTAQSDVMWKPSAPVPKLYTARFTNNATTIELAMN
jgi:hypothetical protein